MGRTPLPDAPVQKLPGFLKVTGRTVSLDSLSARTVTLYRGTIAADWVGPQVRRETLPRHRWSG